MPPLAFFQFSAGCLTKNLLFYQGVLYLLLYLYLTHHRHLSEYVGGRWWWWSGGGIGRGMAAAESALEKQFDIWPMHLNRMADYESVLEVAVTATTGSHRSENPTLPSAQVQTLRIHPFFQK